MRILIDLIHPANFHYFKNLISFLKEKGYNVRITARDKDVMFALLKSKEYPFFNMGKSGNGKLSKFLYLIKAEFLMFYNVILFRPKLIISFSSSFASHNAFLFGIPHITFDDTEHHKINRHLYVPFSKVIFTPDCFMDNLGKKQIRFPGFMELFYLHPNFFTPNIKSLEYLKLNKNEKFVLLRFVSWGAYHDIGQSGLKMEVKVELVKELSKFAKVFISSEGPLPREFEEYRIQIPPEKIHDIMYYATLFIGEGSTMASECAMLGTSAIYVNSLELGYMNSLEKNYGLVYNFRNSDGVLEKAVSLITNENLKKESIEKQSKMFLDLIDPTKMLIWFVENYPDSLKEIFSKPSILKYFK